MAYNKTYFHILSSFLITFIALFVITRILHDLLIDDQIDYYNMTLGAYSQVKFTMLFFLIMPLFLYLLSVFQFRMFLEIKVKDIIFYCGILLLCGALLEITVNSLFELLIGRKSWKYIIWPLNDGNTSFSSLIVWPCYGFHLYLTHLGQRLKKEEYYTSKFYRSVYMGLDAMWLEVLANSFAIITVGSYYFFYLRNDLYNFTSSEIYIPYFFAGLLGMFIIDFFEKHKNLKVLVGVTSLICGLLIVIY